VITEEQRKEFQKNAHAVIVAIDEKSLRKKELGMWPWPRDRVAKLTEEIVKCGAKVVGFDAVFSEPDRHRIAPVVKEIVDRYSRVKNKDLQFEKDIVNILTEVDGDTKFARVLEDNENIVLGFFFFRVQEQIEDLDLEDLKAVDSSMDYGTVEFVKANDQNNLKQELEDNLFSAVAIRGNIPY